VIGLGQYPLSSKRLALMRVDKIARANKLEQLYPIIWNRTAVPNDRMLL
jgi:hypothetical protein